MRKIVSIILALFVVFGIGSLAFASDVSGANYYGVIRATNTGTAITNVAANVSINTTALIASGFLDATATNAAVRVSSTDVPFMPGNDGDPWIVHYDSIGQNSNSDVTLYTGNVTGGKIVFFPDTAGMTIPDDASLEVGDNFTVSINNAWIDTTAGTDKNILRKDDAIYLYESTTTSGNIIVDIPTPVASNTIKPDGDGDHVGLNLYGGSNRITIVTDGNDGTSVYTDATGTGYDLYTFGNITNYYPIASVTLYFRTRPGKPDVTTYFTPIMSIGGTIYSGTQQSTTSSAFVDRSEVFTVNPSTGADWTINDVNSLQAGVNMTGDGSYTVYCAEYWAVVTYDNLSCEVIGITSGEYSTLTVSANTTHLILSIDGTSNSAALNGVSMPDNANDWVFFENDSTMYVGDTTVTIDGVDVSAWGWEYGALFADSIGSNDATPSFRTTSSDPDVSAELINFNPYTKSTVDDDTALTWPTIMTDPPELPDTMYTENATPGFFFAGIIHALSTVSDIPESLFWYNFAFLIIIIVGIFVYYIVESSKSNTGTPGKLFIKILCQAILMCVFALPGLNIYGFFVPLYYLFFAGGIFMLSKDFGW